MQATPYTHIDKLYIDGRWEKAQATERCSIRPPRLDRSCAGGQTSARRAPPSSGTLSL